MWLLLRAQPPSTSQDLVLVFVIVVVMPAAAAEMMAVVMLANRTGPREQAGLLADKRPTGAAGYVCAACMQKHC